MELKKKAATSGMVYKYLADGDQGLLYIMKNGYPNKSVYKDGNYPEIDQYITQAAVWWYLDDVAAENGQTSQLSSAFKTTDPEAYSGIRDAIKSLVNGAKAARNTATVKPSMTFSVNNTSLTLSSDKKYYESSYLNATVKGATTYKVTATGAKNIEIISEDGSAKTTFNSGDKFKVRIPASSVSGKTTINVKTTATSSTEKVATYQYTDSQYQKMVSAKVYTTTVNLEKSANLSLNAKNVCSVVDGTYYGKDGNAVSEKTYNKECGKVCTVENDKYYGADGTVVDKKTYNKECGKVCTVENDKYYGADGSEVSKTKYEEECGTEVAVPNTGANASFIGMIIGLISILGGTGLLAYRRKVRE
jgi:TQXA domain-containing protein/LPXTG-motif cell wall-anchored protein